MKKYFKTYKIFVVLSLIISLVVYFRYQISYWGYAFVRPIAGAISSIAGIPFFWDETHNSLSSIQVGLIDFWSPSFRYKISDGDTAGDVVFSEYRDQDTIILMSAIQCDSNIIIDGVNPDDVVFISLENDEWGVYKYADTTYLYNDCGFVKNISDLNNNYSSWEFMEGNSSYFTDQKSIYYRGEIVVEADVDTFQIDHISLGKDSNGNSRHADARDENNLYYAGTIIQSN